MITIGRAVLVLGIVVGISGCGGSAQVPAQATGAEQAGAGKTYEKVRGPAVAGQFYPRHPQDLTKQIDGFLAAAKPAEVKNLRGLVCPHAGYEYSGQTAAFGYKLLTGRNIRTVIVMAPSHYAAFRGAALPKVDAFETPLGMVPLSPKTAELAKSTPFAFDPPSQVRRPQQWRLSPAELPPFGEDTPHTWEHSLEVQLPFLQRTLKDFTLVPIVFGQDVEPEAAARALAKQLDARTLVVASSDLSHYLSYDTATELDTTCVKAICSLNTEWMEGQDACGKVPILVLMHIARAMGWQAKLLDYHNSGDVTGDKSRVVGYAAVAFFEPEGKAAAAKPAAKAAGQNEFSPAQRKFLLELARGTVTEVVDGRSAPELKPAEAPRGLDDMRACFVTLTKQGQLRGCIGSIFPREPLCQSVIHGAKSAAIEDPRFRPVAPAELKEIEIEISVLTMPEPLPFESPEDLLKKLRPNVDGVVLRVGRAQATFLPQVWEQIPKKEDFLGHLARKAGLAESDWRKPETKVLTYQVEAFKEREK